MKTLKSIPQPAKPHIQKGKGDRDLDCRQYNDCLDHAAAQYWPAFNCEKCPISNLASDKPLTDTTSAPRTSTDALSSKTNDTDRPIPGKADKEAASGQSRELNTTVELNFKHYPEALKRIKKSAKKKGRSLEFELMVRIIADLMRKDPDYYRFLMYKESD